MSTERILAEARLAVRTVNENEAAWFVLYVIAAVLMVALFMYLVKNWSWIPRKRQRRVFIERF